MVQFRSARCKWRVRGPCKLACRCAWFHAKWCFGLEGKKEIVWAQILAGNELLKGLSLHWVWNWALKGVLGLGPNDKRGKVIIKIITKQDKNTIK